MLQKLKYIILIFSLILFNNSKLFASNLKSQINFSKSNVSKFMVNEWDKTVKFQKIKFNEMKIQTENHKRDINKILKYFR